MASSDQESSYNLDEEALLEMESKVEEELAKVQKVIQMKKRMLNVQEKKEKLALLKNQLSDSLTSPKVGEVVNKETQSTSSLVLLDFYYEISQVHND